MSRGFDSGVIGIGTRAYPTSCPCCSAAERGRSHAIQVLVEPDDDVPADVFEQLLRRGDLLDGAAVPVVLALLHRQQD